MFTTKRRLFLLPVLPVALLLNACTSPLQRKELTVAEMLEQQGYRQAETVDSIPSYTINALIALDADNIVLYATGERRYLLYLAHTCPNLSATSALGYTTTAGHLTKYDKIYLLDSSGRPPDCVIKDIYQLEPLNKQEAQTHS